MGEHVFVASVRRQVVDGEEVGISLDLIRDTDTVELVEGGEYVTVRLVVDPFDGPPE